MNSSQYPVDPVTLRIDGVDWKFWKSIEVTRQMDAVAGAFSISLADKWVNGAQALPIAAGMACEMFIGNDSVVNGYIDKVSPGLSANDHGIGVSGRDRSADLVDCAAVHRPGHWLGQNAQQLASALAAPFNVPVIVEGDMGAPFGSFKLEQGETAFEALDRALKQRELLACPDGAGGLVLLRVGARQSAVALVQGENVLSANADFDLTDRFSRYIVQGQQPGTDEVYGLAACAVAAESVDSAVTRYRPYLLRADSNVDASSARQRAAWEKTVRAARSVTLSVTVQGFRQGKVGTADGPLWQVNALTDVDIPYLRIAQRMVISKVSFRRDATSGSITTLELKDPAAFTPEPKKQVSKNGASGKDGPIEAEKDLQSRFAEDAAKQQRQLKEGRQP